MNKWINTINIPVHCMTPNFKYSLSAHMLVTTINVVDIWTRIKQNVMHIGTKLWHKSSAYLKKHTEQWKIAQLDTLSTI